MFVSFSILVEALEAIIQTSKEIFMHWINTILYKVKPVLMKHIKLALHKPRKDTNIIIKSIDINLELVIMNKSWYVQEGFWELLDDDIYPSIVWDELCSRIEMLEHCHTNLPSYFKNGNLFGNYKTFEIPRYISVPTYINPLSWVGQFVLIITTFLKSL